ncbi:hypothetical protein ANCCAN_26951 [Ancylostoma caninum]|uniref:Uncharacterized protein n=1 Tax=Ancylostoma caninum TaxID=29170 RepID=A0A368FAW1_ANCCA|nr:hypothetical protein ANCCAN_26951 [Ancylostoma caninum]
MFILFPLVAAQRLCSEDTASCYLLVYWLLIHVPVDGSHHPDVVRGIKNVAQVLTDHAIEEDLQQCGSPYQWSFSPFESAHRRLQLRIVESTTNCEEAIVKNFIMRKELFAKLNREASTAPHPALTRLQMKLANEALNRFVHIY